MSFHSTKAESAYGDVQQISSDAQGLDSQWQEIEGSTAGARQRIINIQSLLDYRSLWPKLISDIQSCLPQAANPQFGALNPAAIKQTPRAQRQLVLIDSMVSDYRPDITQLLAADDIRNYAMQPGSAPPALPQAAQGGENAAPPSADTPHGFLLTLRCISPYSDGGQLVHDKLIPGLLAIKPNTADARHYAVVKAQIVSAVQVKMDPTRMSKMRDDYNKALQAMTSQNNVQVDLGTGGNYGGGNFGGAMSIGGEGPRGGPPMTTGAAAAVPGGPDDTAPFADRITGESTLDDWEVTIIALVQIDPSAQPPAAAGQATPVAAAPGQAPPPPTPPAPVH